MAETPWRPDAKGQSVVTPERWAACREDLPRLLAEIGPTVPNELKHLPSTAAPEQVLAYLHRDGAVIVDRVLTEEVCDAVVREMQPYIDENAYGREAFGGRTTKRIGCLAARSPSSWGILAHPLLMDACAGVLGHQLLHPPSKSRLAPGYKVHPWQLHLTQIIQIEPSGDEPAQSIHRDRWAFVGDSAWDLAQLEPEISTIWALTEFDAASGPTRVVPGSHRWSGSEVPKQERLEAMAAHAVMPKGSVVIYTGSALHGGGKNVGGRARVGLNVDYNLAWLRQEENQYLSCPPSIARHLPERLQRLLGYALGGFALGYWDGGKHPKHVWRDAEAKPINWASDWMPKGHGGGAATSKL